MTPTQLSVFDAADDLSTGLLNGPGQAQRDHPETAQVCAGIERGSQRAAVLLVMADLGDTGAIPEQVKAELAYPGGAHVMATRLAELAERGLVAKTGDLRETWSHRLAEVWVISDAGLAVARELRGRS